MELTEVTFKLITLDWIKDDYRNVPEEPGVYQIYGTSPLYGVDTLLYIGQAENLRKRLKGHFEFKEGVIGRQPNKTCRYAVLHEDLLDAAEQTLIIMHKPSFNSARLINVSSGVRKDRYYIQNHGERGMLNIEVTNYYFPELPNDNSNDEDMEETVLIETFEQNKIL